MKNIVCTLLISALIASNRWLDADFVERFCVFLGFILPTLMGICYLEEIDDKRRKRREFEEKIKRLANAKCK